jgi:Hint domain
MANELKNSDVGMQRTRRNVMKMGAIAVPATLGTVHAAAAWEACVPFTRICFNIPTGGDGSNHSGSGNCFLKGTKILTAEGERKIEDLAIGDLLPTGSGALRPVQWIGSYSLKKSDLSKAWVKDALPVRIARSALAPNVPHADLYVTAAHSLLIDGVLVPAELLINGATITRSEPESDELEFFHIKLESHDVVYAEGVPAETLFYVDDSFTNFPDYLRRYGTPVTEAARCAPIVPVGGRDELKSRFRSALSPWIDFRNHADVVRDRLEEGEIMLAGQAETIGS